jgi:hypothetical protein
MERVKPQGLTIDPTALTPVPVKVSLPAGETQLVLYLDAERNLVYASNPEALAEWAKLRNRLPEKSQPAQAAPGELPGVRFRIDPDGTKVIESVDAITQQAMTFFTDAPCFFEGCAELRAAYERDLERITDSQGNCSDCGAGRLNLKYVPLVIEKLKLAGWGAPVVKPRGDT